MQLSITLTLIIIPTERFIYSQVGRQKDLKVDAPKTRAKRAVKDALPPPPPKCDKDKNKVIMMIMMMMIMIKTDTVRFNTNGIQEAH